MDLQQAGAMLAEGDSGEPSVKSADKDLYCLVRSDIMIVDLSTAGFGEQGMDVLFAHVGGVPVIGITDRFQNAPSLLSRLDCLIVPDSVGQIVHAVELFGGRVKGSASSESDAPTTSQPPSDEPAEVSKEFATRVLRVAGVGKVEDDGGPDQVS